MKHFSYFSLDEEREHFRRDTERQALFQLEKAKTKPVVFAVKTNVAFDGSLDDDSPVHGSAVSFGIGDYLHVMERYDPNWWIGRKVQQDCVIGFIPSPAKLENLRLQVGEKCKIVRGGHFFKNCESDGVVVYNKSKWINFSWHRTKEPRLTPRKRTRAETSSGDSFLTRTRTQGKSK